jgi:hypothetical protein
VVLAASLGLTAGAVRWGWDLDNVTAPLVSTLGDVLTLPALPDLEWISLDKAADPDPKEGLPRVLHTHARTNRIRQSKGACVQAVNAAVEHVECFASLFVDAVNVHGPKRVSLIDRQILRSSVNLTRTGVDDTNPGILPPAGFEDRQLRPTVDLEVGERVLHGRHVPRLTSQIEEIILVGDEIGQGTFIDDVRDLYGDAVLEAADVEPIAAAIDRQVVDNHHICAEVDEAFGQVRPDEAEATGNQYLLSGVGSGHHLRITRGSEQEAPILTGLRSTSDRRSLLNGEFTDQFEGTLTRRFKEMGTIEDPANVFGGVPVSMRSL